MYIYIYTYTYVLPTSKGKKYSPYSTYTFIVSYVSTSPVLLSHSFYGHLPPGRFLYSSPSPIH